jgi:hypothetical protein
MEAGGNLRRIQAGSNGRTIRSEASCNPYVMYIATDKEFEPVKQLNLCMDQDGSRRTAPERGSSNYRSFTPVQTIITPEYSAVVNITGINTGCFLRASRSGIY